jgi:hypothetical protein
MEITEGQNYLLKKSGKKLSLVRPHKSFLHLHFFKIAMIILIRLLLTQRNSTPYSK